MSNDQWVNGFCARLTDVHRRTGVSKAELARRADLPPRTVENYFKGQKPNIPALIRLSRALSVDVGYLIGMNPISGDWNSGAIYSASYNVLEREFLDFGNEIEGMTAIELVEEMRSRLGSISNKIADAFVREVADFDDNLKVHPDHEEA
ncbi:helix-turn-helix domain-containing protein [Jannaschia rubra]|uniref:helix-turn-helix domain-containing protein n=1 Tax=Jannaschia rubra TaxID=282197 RepID=UPI002491844B|nr:helix-turn-helix transcriptional regulator [Jannaschia rubra]